MTKNLDRPDATPAKGPRIDLDGHYASQVTRLLDEHVKLTSEPLILAVRYGFAEESLSLIEVVGNLRGPADGQPLFASFPPSESLRILGNLNLHIVSPSQFRYAIQTRPDWFAKALPDGEVVFQAKGEFAQDLAKEFASAAEQARPILRTT